MELDDVTLNLGRRLTWHRVETQADLPYVGQRRLFRLWGGYILYGRLISRLYIRSLDKYRPGEIDWWRVDAWADDGSEDLRRDERR